MPNGENEPKEEPKLNEVGLEGSQDNIEERSRQLFGHCFEITEIKEGDLLPVGGESIFSDKTEIRVIADIKFFQDFFQAAHDLSVDYQLSMLRG